MIDALPFLTRLTVALLAGVAAYWLARGIGIVAWRDWPPGDATDIAAFVFLALFIRRRANSHG